MVDSKIDELVQQRFRILGEMASLAELRPGRLSCRFQRCGKPGCRCKQEGDPGHGPYYILHFESGGRQTTALHPGPLGGAHQAADQELQAAAGVAPRADRGERPAVRCRIAGQVGRGGTGQRKKTNRAMQFAPHPNMLWASYVNIYAFFRGRLDRNTSIVMGFFPTGECRVPKSHLPTGKLGHLTKLSSVADQQDDSHDQLDASQRP